MKLHNCIKVFIFLAALTSTSVNVSAQSLKETHKQTHQKLLANAKLNKIQLDGLLLNDVESREAAALGNYAGLSKESVNMLSDIVSEAKSHFGKKYKYATHGPSTFDCSGFTGYVYQQFGYNISYGSKHQSTQGVPVDKHHLRPGDLVFFTSPRSGSSVGHVGMVVEADNKNGTFTFIHASVKHGITLEQSTTPYFQRAFLWARRIVTE